MSYVLYGTETDGPYVVEVPDKDTDQYAASVGGTAHASVDAALSAWRDRDQPEGAEPSPIVESDASAPEGEAPAPEAVGDAKPADGQPQFGTETPSESSPTANQS